jgi:hypothetical protein
VPEPDVNIFGTLQGGIVAVGGETTGFLLHNVTIEVDMSAVENADELDASRLRLYGHFEVFEGVETGRRWVFKAHQATRIGD